jgi:hypothetical protein
MTENTTRVGKYVEYLHVTDDPHEKYCTSHPTTGEELSPGIPILKTVPGGSIVKKSVTYKRVKCPECGIEAKYDADSEPTCPACGIICGGTGHPTDDEIVRDAKAAGRVE